MRIRWIGVALVLAIAVGVSGVARALDPIYTGFFSDTAVSGYDTVANGATAPGDPQVWRVVDGWLYLNVNKSIQSEWEKDIPGYIRSADANWPKLLKAE